MPRDRTRTEVYFVFAHGSTFCGYLLLIPFPFFGTYSILELFCVRLEKVVKYVWMLIYISHKSLDLNCLILRSESLI